MKFPYRNSYGDDWGENGYIRIIRNGTNNGLTACYAIFAGLDLSEVPTTEQETQTTEEEVTIELLDSSEMETTDLD